MTVGTLQKHPQIISFGELFVSNRIGFLINGFDRHSKELLYLRRKYPIEFLERQIFASYPNEIKAVGFKVFPDQLDNKQFHCVWDWIIKNKDIKIILLKRRNLLAVYASELIARETQKFWISDESERTSTTVTIDYNDCLEKLETREAYNNTSLRYLKDHDVLEITYEDLVQDLVAGFTKLHEFLGVDLYPPEISTVKREVRPLNKVITNYAHLRDKFSNTKWRYLFEEQ